LQYAGMMRYLIAVVALVLCGCVQERAGVSYTEVPPPVLKTIQRTAPGKIDSILREKKDGFVTYKAKVTSGEKGWDLVVEEDGDLVSKKER